MLLDMYTININGFLVAWKYVIGRQTDSCSSYAAIWREVNGVYIRVVHTRLNPKNPQNGQARVQYVFDSTVLIKKGDFLGLYVGTYDGCNGNLVSSSAYDKNSTEVGAHEILTYKDADSAEVKHPIELKREVLVAERRAVSLQAIVKSMFIMICVENKN